ncbi:Amino-acid acetyltransferase, mitochondrial [Xanthoria calcicola]
MRIRPGAFLQGRTTTLREACCLLPPLPYSIWSHRVNAAGPGVIVSLPLSCSAYDPTPRAKYNSELSAGASKRKREDLGIKELFLDVLGATATKREAKTYLSRFRSGKPAKLQALPEETQKDNVGVNLGNLYVPIRAVDQSPVFEQGSSKAQYVDQIAGPLHTALVKIRDTQAIDDRTLRAVGLTLVQLSRLGMSSVVVVDGERKMQNNDPGVRRSAIEQADRVAAAIDEHGGHGARRLDNVLTTTDVNEWCRSSLKIRSDTHVTNRNLILNPLRKGKIPVVVPVAFNSRTQALVHVTADEAMLTLTRDFAGLRPGVLPESDPQAAAEKVESMQKEISIDRIIILDPLGGLPAIDKQDQCHVFINLEQEYDAIKTELSSLTAGTVESNETETRLISKKGTHSMPTSGNSISAFWEAQSSFTANAEFTKPRLSTIASHVSGQAKVHLQNLELLRDGLAMLPPSSSGLLTTAQKAANSDRSSQDSFSTPGVGTRRQRNALIHNLLTDKPDFSSSLPLRRTQQPISTTDQTIFINPATFFKRGMPITIVPDPRTQPWQSPLPSSSSISLSDPRLDLPRLLHLIEDSFNRKLDVPHYLSRIKDRIAGIIIAGEYEGGALLTWESPPSKPSIMVPYLDKFAVLKRSQGAGGVADIVFNAMVRTCFPDGVCWRSRRDNPVNKWYFERARGTWKIPASNWTMFWTTEGVQAGDGKGVFGDYESVCRGVVPSWADNKSVID